MFGCGKFFSLLWFEHSLQICEYAGSEVLTAVVKVNRRFGETWRLPLQGPGIGNYACLTLVAWLILRLSGKNRHVPPKCLLTFNGIQGQTIDFFRFGVLWLLRIPVIWKKHPPYQKGLYQERCSFLSHMNVLWIIFPYSKIQYYTSVEIWGLTSCIMNSYLRQVCKLFGINLAIVSFRLRQNTLSKI